MGRCYHTGRRASSVAVNKKEKGGRKKLDRAEEDNPNRIAEWRPYATAAHFFAINVSAGCAYAAPLIVVEHLSVSVTGVVAVNFASTFSSS